MAKVVQPNFGQRSPFEEPVKGGLQVAWIDRRPVSGREDQVPFVPGPSVALVGVSLFLLLSCFAA